MREEDSAGRQAAAKQQNNAKGDEDIWEWEWSFFFFISFFFFPF